MSVDLENDNNERVFIKDINNKIKLQSFIDRYTT